MRVFCFTVPARSHPPCQIARGRTSQTGQTLHFAIDERSLVRVHHDRARGILLSSGTRQPFDKLRSATRSEVILGSEASRGRTEKVAEPPIPPPERRGGTIRVRSTSAITTPLGA